MTARRDPRKRPSDVTPRRVGRIVQLWVGAAVLSVAALGAAADGPPYIIKQVEDATLRVGYDVLHLHLEDYFGGKHVECFAESSDPSVAQAIINGLRVRVIPKSAGTATIRVGSKNEDGESEQSFQVTVVHAPPEIGGPLPDASVRVGESITVNIKDAFTGPVDSYGVESLANAMATASIDGSMVTITGVAAGSAMVEVSATNLGGTTTRTFGVAVMDVPPAVAAMLEAVTVQVGMTVTVDIDGSFSGTALRYGAMSLSEGLATVSLDGTMLSVTGVAAGSATVSVTATNSAASASQDLAVTVEDVPPMAAEMLPDVTLFVGDSTTVEVEGAFSGTALNYSMMASSDASAMVSLEGSSIMITGLAAGSTTVTVMATNSAAGAEQSFMVTVRDVPPSVAGALPDLTLVVGGAPAVVDLAAAFGGSALVFGARSADVAVTVSVAGAHLSVAPMIEGTATVNVTATNTEGTAAAEFRVTVNTDAAEVEAIERSLAALGAATLSSVQSAFAARFRGPGAAIPVRETAWTPGVQGLDVRTGGASAPAAGWHRPVWGTQGQGAWNGASSWNGISNAVPSGNAWDQAVWQQGLLADDWNDVRRRHPAGAGLSRSLGGNSFVLPLSAAGGGGIGGFSLWGHADQQSFEGDGVDGDLTSIYVGTDARIGEDWLVGVAASQSDGDVDYRFAGSAASGTGTLSTEMMTILPYVKWDVDLCTDLWAVLGFGSGDIESRRSVVSRTSEADLTMSLVSAGASRVVSSGEGWSITLLGDVASVRMDTDGITGAISNVEVDVSRVRAAVEGKRTVVMDDGARIVLFGQLGARSDSGDGDTGQGAEVSAGVRYNTAGRFSLEFMGRFLANHSEDDVEESAFSVSAMLRPQPDGSGLSVALSSRLGSDFGMYGMSGAPGMVPGIDYDYVRRARRGQSDDWGFDTRLGYGVPLEGLSGVLTPFATVDLASSDRRGARVGARFDAGRQMVELLSVELSAGRAYHFYDDSMAGLVELRGELRF